MNVSPVRGHGVKEFVSAHRAVSAANKSRAKNDLFILRVRMGSLSHETSGLQIQTVSQRGEKVHRGAQSLVSSKA